MVLDLTLDGLKIPGLPTFTPLFGTKKADGVGLSTGEVNDNVLMPWNRQRPYSVAETSSTGEVEADSTIALLDGCAAITLGDGAYNGVEVKLINTTANYLQLITGQETGWILPHQTIRVMWFVDCWYVDDGHMVGEIINVSFPIDKMPFGYLTLQNRLRPSRTAYKRLANTILYPLVDRPFTCTTATPSVFTIIGHGFVGGERLRLFTSGTLTGATLSQDYFVEKIGVDTFYLNTLEGSTTRLAITAQSGTHYCQVSAYGVGDGSTTMDLPDPNQSVFVGAGASSSHNIASVDTYLYGQFKDDSVQGMATNANVLYWGWPNIDYDTDIGWGAASIYSDGLTYDGVLNKELRKKAVTRTKQLGANFIIKY